MQITYLKELPGPSTRFGFYMGFVRSTAFSFSFSFLHFLEYIPYLAVGQSGEAGVAKVYEHGISTEEGF